MDVSVEKTIATIFTLHPHGAQQEISLFMGDSRLRQQPTSTSLVVRLDRTLPFRQHVISLQAKLGKRSNAPRAVSRKAWGGNTGHLGALYLTYIRACAMPPPAGCRA